MTKNVQACHTGDRLVEAAGLMKEFNVGFVPVVDDDSFVVGAITDRDICLAAYRYREPLQTIPVTEVMSEPVITCTTHTGLPAAQRIMTARRVRRLIVLDASGRLTGVLSVDDLARAFARGQLARPESVLSTIAAAADRRVVDRAAVTTV